MAVGEHKAITDFDQWYVSRKEDPRTGCLEPTAHTEAAMHMYRMFEDYKREHRGRVANYYKLEMLANGEVVSKKKDLPNISSGETAGIVRRMARNLVQHTPNVEVVCKFDDDSAEGIFARHILLTKIIGSDEYSNDMQQNLFASTKSALTLGFDCVIPLLLQDAAGSWFIKYDNIGYQDVFPEPGARDVRQATSLFVRRYLTKGEVKQLIRDQVEGWDILALKDLLKSNPPARQQESAAHEDKKHHTIPDGYEIITWYSNSGDPFLTFSATTKNLLRIEKNKHPMNEHPVHFLVLEKDAQQPLGKSQVELLFGRQEFQDLMLNGAMKMWYRNINPPLFGYGNVNSVPNLSPGKYNELSNPNAKVEAFQTESQTLLQYGTISQQNMGSMVNLVGSADQQMAVQAGGGMSATPQGVEAQQTLVDITTNNYQKAIESFFSHYCSYALTIYFAELRAAKKVIVSADTRKKLINAGMPPEDVVDEAGRVVMRSPFNEDGTLNVSFADLAIEYFVRTVPGSLVELEDEKQRRILNELFVPLSQAMPAIAQTQDPDALAHAVAAMRFIVESQIKLSGSAHSTSLSEIFAGVDKATVDRRQKATDDLELRLGGISADLLLSQTAQGAQIEQMQEDISTISQTLATLLEKLGVSNAASTPEPNSSEVA